MDLGLAQINLRPDLLMLTLNWPKGLIGFTGTWGPFVLGLLSYLDLYWSYSFIRWVQASNKLIRWSQIHVLGPIFS